MGRRSRRGRGSEEGRGGEKRGSLQEAVLSVESPAEIFEVGKEGKMRDKIVVTIEPPRPRERLDIAGAFEQVLDFLKLMELAAGDDADFQWELEKATTNSPFTVIAVASNRQAVVARGESLPVAQAKVQNGLEELVGGTVPNWMRRKQRATARSIVRRYREGIGRVALRSDESASRHFYFNSTMAAKALVTLEKVDEIEDIFVPAHRSYGEIEGALLEVGEHRGKPALWIRTNGYDVVRCIVDQKKLEGIGEAASLKSIWQHQRVRLVGALWFKEGGSLEQIHVDKLDLFLPPSVSLDEILDPGFTGGLDPVVYLERLSEGEAN